MILAHEVVIGFGGTFSIAAGLMAWALLTRVYHRGWLSSAMPERRRLVAFASGLALVIGVTTSPLEHLAEDLVSVHMVQHVALLLFAAPAIALSRPVETLLKGLPRRYRKGVGGWRRRARLTPSTTTRMARPVVVWLLYGLAIWLWHGSRPYEIAARNTWAHLVEHGVFLGAALAFWSVVLVPGRFPVGAGYRILMVFTTAFHSVLLGALLTFSDDVWYRSYVDTTIAVGLDPLSDQRLASLLMWIPGSLVYTAAGLWLLTSWLGAEAGMPGHRRTEEEIEISA